MRIQQWLTTGNYELKFHLDNINLNFPTPELLHISHFGLVDDKMKHFNKEVPATKM